MSLLLLAGMMLAGCSGFGGKDPPPVVVDPNVFPSDYKAQIMALLQSRLADPSSVREPFVSDPMLKPVGQDNRYVVCVRYDARNNQGKYIGSRDHVAYFLIGRINQLVDATNECVGANYQPFPELQGLRRPS